MNVRTFLTSAAFAIAALSIALFAETSTANPRMQAVLDQLAALGGRPLETLSAAEARKQPTPADAEINLSTRKDLKGLPPTTVITADIDPLRTEGQMLARALQRAGVVVATRNFEGVAHEFFGMGAVLPEAKDAVAFAAAELKKSFVLRQHTTARSPGR